jgi:hypothetical protein
VQKAEPKKCQPLSMVTLIMSKFSLAEAGERAGQTCNLWSDGEPMGQHHKDVLPGGDLLGAGAATGQQRSECGPINSRQSRSGRPLLQ